MVDGLRDSYRPGGGNILYTQIYVSAYNAAPIVGSYYVVSVQIKKNAGSFAAANIQLAFNEIPVCDPNTNVSFTIT